MEQTAELDTAGLVRAARRGDTAAFERLVDRYERTALAVAYGVLRNGHDAGDVVQDAFVKAWQKLGDLQSPQGFSAWLCGIVRNLAVDTCRRRKREVAVRVADDPADHAQAVPVEADPSVGLQHEERSRTIAAALDQLDETSRSAVVLRYYDGLSSREIGQALGLSPAAVDMRLSRARAELRDVLTEKERT